MPSANGTSIAEKLMHAKAMIRFALSRCHTDAIWETAEEKELFEMFVERCNRDAHLDMAMLLRIHDDELLQLFEAFQLTPWERTVIRSYLNLPEDALWIMWTTLKIGLVSSVAAFRVGRAAFGLPGLALLTAGAGVGIVGTRFRGRLLTEAKKLLDHGRQLAEEQTAPGPRCVLPPMAPRSAASPEVTLPDDNEDVDLRSNPFYDPADHGLSHRTPRFSIRSLPPYDFSRNTEDHFSSAGGASAAAFSSGSQPRYFSQVAPNRNSVRQREVVWEDPASAANSVPRRDPSQGGARTSEELRFIPSTAAETENKSSESLPHTEDSFERL